MTNIEFTPPPRKKRSTKERARIFSIHGGICHICKGKINAATEAWDISHDIPLAAGGKDDDKNSQPAHRKCHRTRTDKVDAPLIAKVRRQMHKNNGTHQPTQTMQSAGFQKKPKPEKLPLPKQPGMYEDITR